MSGKTAQLILSRNKNTNPLYKVTGHTHNPSVQGEIVESEKKEMLNWANGHLQEMPDAKLMSSLETDLGDGLTLLHLAEELACEVPPCYHDNPVMRFQKIENIAGCLNFLADRGVSVMNISAADLVDCRLKAALALCHALRLRFDDHYAKRHQKNTIDNWKHDSSGHIPYQTTHKPSKLPGKETSNLITLMLTQKQQTDTDKTSHKKSVKMNRGFECGYHGYYGSLFGNRNIGGIVILYKEDMAVLSWVQKLVKITIPDYTVFEDGIILCAIVNHLCNGVITHEEILFHTPEERLEIAIETAQYYLGVPPQLNIAAVVKGKGQNELLSYLQMLKSTSQYITQGSESESDKEREDRVRRREHSLKEKLEKHREELINEKAVIGEFFKSLETELEEYNVKRRQQDDDFISKLKEEERLSRQRYEESMLQLEKEKEDMLIKKHERKLLMKQRSETAVQCSLDNDAVSSWDTKPDEEYDIDILSRWKRKRKQKSVDENSNKNAKDGPNQTNVNKHYVLNNVERDPVIGPARITPFYRHFGPDRYSEFLAMTENAEPARSTQVLKRTIFPELKRVEKVSGPKIDKLSPRDISTQNAESSKDGKIKNSAMNNTISPSERNKGLKLPSIRNDFNSDKNSPEPSKEKSQVVKDIAPPTLVHEDVVRSKVEEAQEEISTNQRRQQMKRQHYVDDKSDVALTTEVAMATDFPARSAPSSPQLIRRRHVNYSSPVSMYSTDKFFSAYSMPFISVMDADLIQKQLQRRKSLHERDIEPRSLPAALHSSGHSEMLRISHNKSKSLPADVSRRFSLTPISGQYTPYQQSRVAVKETGDDSKGISAAETQVVNKYPGITLFESQRSAVSSPERKGDEGKAYAPRSPHPKSGQSDPHSTTGTKSPSITHKDVANASSKLPKSTATKAVDIQGFQKQSKGATDAHTTAAVENSATPNGSAAGDLCEILESTSEMRKPEQHMEKFGKNDEVAKWESSHPDHLETDKRAEKQHVSHTFVPHKICRDEVIRYTVRSEELPIAREIKVAREALPWQSEKKYPKLNTETESPSGEISEKLIQKELLRHGETSTEIQPASSTSIKADGNGSVVVSNTEVQDIKKTIQPLYQSVSSHKGKDGEVIESQVVLYRIHETESTGKSELRKGKVGKKKETCKKKAESSVAKEATMMVRMAARQPGAKVKQEVVPDSF
ncbi:muscle M-line assembly protein unc-89-like [Ptychodera flava]|uniref:muscle M-line assembly protein unc-89-like n=1 Tax=Ptychodera flava TaxID=63121 RepID=UPI00396A3CE5